MTYYQELGVSPSARAEDIRKAYRTLSKLLHPDQQTEPEMRRAAEIQMQRLNGMVEVLLDDERRRRYDESLLSPKPRLALPAPAVSWWSFLEMLRRPSVLALLATITAAIGLTLAVLWFMAGDLMHFGAAQAAPPAVTTVKQPTDSERTLQSAKAVSRRKQTTVTAQPSVATNTVPGLHADPTIPTKVELAAVKPTEESELEMPATPASHKVGSATPNPRNDPAPATNPSLDGLWVYAPAANKQEHCSTLLYAPEYIELHVRSAENVVFGEYISRYRVEDKAISPYVKFTFQGSGNPETFAWKAEDGSRGTVGLKVLSPQTMQVNWRVTEFGSSIGLGAGTAVLVRKIEQ